MVSFIYKMLYVNPMATTKQKPRSTKDKEETQHTTMENNEFTKVARSRNSLKIQNKTKQKAINKMT